MQAIKYKWNMGSKSEPFLFLSDGRFLRKMKLIGENVSLTIGGKKCIGYFREGRRIECPAGRAVERDWHCNECKLEDDFFMCIKCDGSDCMNDKQRPTCKEDVYFIYLAAFDSILKVGISRERRLLERLVEQGADFGAKIAVVKDGKDVRSVEQEISRYLKISDRVSGADKQKHVFGSPNTAVTNISSAIAKLQSNGISKYMVPPEIFDLRSYYHLSNVHYNPSAITLKDGMKIEGEIIAAKGAVLILKSGTNLFSINAHDLIGRDILQEEIITNAAA